MDQPRKSETPGAVSEFTSGNFLPLSMAQQQIWYAQVAAGDAPIFNLMATYRIPFAIDEAQWLAAVDQTVADSDVLQTVFTENSPVNIQQRRDVNIRANCTVVDLQEQQLDNWCTQQGLKTLDITRQCFQFNVLRFSKTSYVFFFNVHHIIADGGFLSLFWRQVVGHYEYAIGFRDMQPEPFPLYHQHVLKQRATVDSEFRQTAFKYWNERIEQRSYPAHYYGLDTKPDTRVHRHSWTVEPAWCEKINTAISRPPFSSHSPGFSLFILMAMTMMVTGWKTQGEAHQRIGFPSRSRREKAMSQALGLFISMGFLDIEFVTGDTPASVAPRIQEQMREAFSHLDSSVYSARLTRAFTSSLNVLIAPVGKLMGKTIDTHWPYNGFSDSGSAFDLHVLDLKGDGHYTFLFDTAESVFDEHNRKRLVTDFKIILGVLLDNPEQLLSQIELLPDRQRTSMLKSLCGKPTTTRADERIHVSFENMANASPQEFALIQGNHRMTYGELDERASQLQVELEAAGVVKNTLVATCFERSIAGFVAVLAILKAQAVFVPLDPSYPKARQQLVLSESKASFALCHEPTEKLPCLNVLPWLCLGERGQVIRSSSPESLLNHIAQRVSVSVDAVPAYVLYTSGSTGVPKGVIGTHQATLNRLQWMWRDFPFGVDEVSCHKTSLSFVDSIWELFGPLLAGVPSVILSDDDVLDIYQFTEALVRYRITRLVLVPSLLAVLLESGTKLQQELDTLKLVLVSGEPLKANIAKRFHEQFKDVELVNLYGSTEVSADVTYCKVTPTVTASAGQAGGVIPIGSPIDGNQLLVLDDDLNLVPQGTPGELAVVGCGVSAGYLNASITQSESFTQTRYRKDEKVFRTGDLVRLNAQGHLQYLGRKDAQIKLQGRRIEPAEIEHHMLSQPSIKRCAVGVNQAGSLFACYESRSSDRQCLAELEVQLQAVLPNFMVPKILFSLEKMPTLPNGKTDYRHIAVLSEQHDKALKSRYEPLNLVESKLLDLWRQVLKLNAIDLTADFFDIGGNSVAAMGIVIAAREAHLNLTLENIFVIGSIRGIAARCDLLSMQPAVAEEIGAEPLPKDTVNSSRRCNPSNAKEEAFFTIFLRVFPERHLDIEADFFSSGGNSISAMQLMVAAKQDGYSLRLNNIIELSSLAELAKTLQPLERSGAISRVDKSDEHVPRVILSQLNTLNISIAPEQLDYYPLTAPQRGILFHLLMLGMDKPLYVTQGRADLYGAIDPELFHTAWRKLTLRHDAMRSVVLHEDLLEPVQVVLPNATIDWQTIDMSALSQAEQFAQREAIAQRNLQTPIPLNRAPLMRVVLIKQSRTLFHVIVDFHHILFDGWSAASFTDELATLYQALRDERPLTLPEPGQYRDHVLAIRQVDEQQTRAFWKSKLSGFKKPTLISNLTQQSHYFATGNHRVIIDTELTKQLNELAVQCRVTVNTVIQSAWALLLSRRSHQEDVLYGFAVSGRSSGINNYQNTIGMFVNSLPMRVDCNGSYDIKFFMKSLQTELLSLIEYEHSSLTDVVRESDVEPHLNLFDSLLVFQNVPQANETEDAPFRVRNRHNHENSHIPLTVEVFPEEAIRILFLYIPQYCDHRLIQRVSDQFTRILNDFTSLGPSGVLADVASNSQKEIIQTIRSFNETQFSYPANTRFTDLIWQQAGVNPEKIAVRFLTEKLSYRTLTERVDRVAAHLNHLGLEQGAVAGVFAARSINLLVSILAVVRCGAAYVPIDPEYPNERITHIIEDSGTRFILCQSNLLPPDDVIEIRVSQNVELVLVDSVLENSQGSCAKISESNSTYDELAYVIYTSGSTGVPKGVQVTHKNVLNFLCSMQQTPGFRQSDRLLALTTVSFDISVLELFLPLVCGGSLDIAPQPMLYDAFQLKAYLDEQSTDIEPISVMQATPTTWRLLLASNWQGDGTMRCLIGGEALPSDLPAALVPHVHEIWNMYGPTETTVWSSCAHITDPNARITIGRPIGNTQILVLGPDGELCPINKPGELCIIGDGVALGYHNRAKLTGEKFVPVPPFLDDNDRRQNARMFRTGDLARWLDDGQLECLGRIDRQVKLHGYRIELGEVESVINGIDGVSHSVVQLYTTQQVDRLVAFVVTDSTSDASRAKNEFEAELRIGARAKLPEYMVPAAFVRIETLPRLPNGKIDRDNLPNPFNDPANESIPVNKLLANSDDVNQPENCPKNSLETQLHAVFCEVLDLENVSVNSNFFDIGGNSLMAMRIVASSAAAGVEVQIPQIFQLATIRDIAAVCKPVQADPSSSSKVDSKPTHEDADKQRIMALLSAKKT